MAQGTVGDPVLVLIETTPLMHLTSSTSAPVRVTVIVVPDVATVTSAPAGEAVAITPTPAIVASAPPTATALRDRPRAVAGAFSRDRARNMGQILSPGRVKLEPPFHSGVVTALPERGVEHRRGDHETSEQVQPQECGGRDAEGPVGG